MDSDLFLTKIENIVYEAVPYFQASSGSGSCSPCNGSTQLWSSYTTQSCQVSSTNPSTINGVKASAGNTGSPLWLPAGTTLAGETKTCTPNAGSYSNSCICPPPSVTAKTYISIIEFNIIPWEKCYLYCASSFIWMVFHKEIFSLIKYLTCRLPAMGSTTACLRVRYGKSKV